MTKVGIESVAKGCPNLKELNLRYCFQLNDECLKVIGAMLSNIKTLKLGACTKITTDGIIFIANGCKAIEVLDLYYCKKVTAEGVANFAKQCNRIKELNLRGLADLQGIAWIETVVKCCPLLATLNLRGVEQASDEWLEVLATAKKLTALDLTMCNGISDAKKAELFADGVVRALVQ